ncbi:DNA-binding protein [Bacteroides stercorirosoris]|uniref:DNA-binding protein n=1 Tax=Bacteroides stercorirosoris TaxID=871324 RepID=UPI000A686AEC|nr:DNA-binding protein [Bacteroides stercorirosoris]
MRKQEEINRAAAILRKKGDRISVAQAEVLEQRRTETQLFKEFVVSAGEDKKDDKFFYALRDAARFAAGGLELEELIPDAEKYPVELVPAQKKERQTVSYQEYQALMRRVNLLEGLVDELCKERRQRAEYQKKPDTNRADFISQEETTKWVGCSRETLNSWQRKDLSPVIERRGGCTIVRVNWKVAPKCRTSVA